MKDLRAIMVAVDYGDLLAVTLPWNRHHFSEVHVVTDQKCEAEVRELCIANHAEVHVTDRFYRGGASFNKWSALEWALDCIGRTGWLCVMDADVLWPRNVEVKTSDPRGRFLGLSEPGQSFHIKEGELMSPLRRMASWPSEIPEEVVWGRYPIHRNVNEWAGYSQVFHAQDPHLPEPPWHETNWKHAGGADSLFQRHWPMTQKRRPPWECLHLGEAGQNWYGRATPLVDGSVPEQASERRAACARIWEQRRELRAQGASESERFAPEKLS